MIKSYEDIRLDKAKNAVVITKQEFIELRNTGSIDGLREKLKEELRQIVVQVKSLKHRADEIKLILDKLSERAGPTGPAPQKTESSPVDSAHPTQPALQEAPLSSGPGA